MSKTDAVISIAEVYEMTAGDKENPVWINNPVKGVVRTMNEKKMKTGKPFWACILADEVGSATCEVSFFAKPQFSEGDLIELSGQGMRRTEYKGTAQIAISEKTQIHRLGGSAHHQEQKQAAAEGKPSVSGEPQHVFGATAGMAVKAAIEYMENTQPDPAANQDKLKPSDPAYWEAVWQYASDVVRISRLIEAGKLAKPVKERAAEAGEDVPY
jgi:hypothetical protein